ncbi:DMT family transporter [Brevibacillus fulvus]|uniref:Drug/metabolite transporter (DMT)-like permease n=1 Tax=Brevibacillus fulvus TaxID=1125967 RepID=A0A938XX20_9BACL|nr:DMT family transporter [Brevibacillus fulvus]MBM7589719.1 drug/metabolite transporter (DMT)-like permease [Brevibacillus fulvus]
MKYMYTMLLLFTSFLWAGNFVVSKFLVDYASSITLTDLRWIIAVLCLVPLVWIREKRIIPPAKAIIPLILMGITGVVFFNLFMFWALQRTTSSNVGLLSTLNPVSIALFSFLLIKERLNRFQLMAMAISLIGVLIVLCKGEIGKLVALQFNTGDLWMVAAVAMWGLYSVFGKWAMKWVSPMMSTLYSGLFGVLLLLPFNLGDFHVTKVDLTFCLSILYVSVLSTVVCMVMWNIGVQRLGATTAGMFLNFNPIFTGILAFLLLDERLTWLQLAGSALVIVGCVLFSRLKTAGRQLSH